MGDKEIVITGKNFPTTGPAAVHIDEEHCLDSLTDGSISSQAAGFRIDLSRRLFELGAKCTPPPLMGESYDEYVERLKNDGR